MVRRYVFLFALMVLGIGGSAQKLSEAKIEQRVIAYDKVVRDTDDRSVGDDSLIGANERLMKFLVRVLKADPSTLRMPFNKIREQTSISILSSEDGKLRFYYWPTGLHWSIYNLLLQYKTPSGVRLSVWNSVSGNIQDVSLSSELPVSISTVRRGDGSTVYLVITHYLASRSAHVETIIAYDIANGKLIAIPFFETRNRVLKEIIFEYDPQYEQNSEVDASIHLSRDKRSLYIPVVNSNHILTRRHLVYKFDGDKFVYDKNAR